MSSVAEWISKRKEKSLTVKREIERVNPNQWNACLSSKDGRSRFSSKGIKIGTGTFGNVFRAQLGNEWVVIKESYAPKDDDKTRTYSEEYKILSMIDGLLKSNVSLNFPYVYHTTTCTGCVNFSKNVGLCFLTFMEMADFTLDKLETNLSEAQLKSITYQLLLGLHAIHSTYGIYHRNVSKSSVLIKRVDPGGMFSFRVGTKTILVDNVGLVPLLSEFGNADALNPIFSSRGWYGSRNAKVASERKLTPIICEGPDVQIVRWNNGTIGTKNTYTSTSELKSNIPVNLTDTETYPPFEFFYDIQRVIGMFVEDEPRSRFKDRLKREFVQEFPFDELDTVKYIRADVMLANLYEPPTDEKEIVAEFLSI